MTEATAEVSIPLRHQEICRELARIAKRHGLQRLVGSYGPAYDDPWRSDIAFHWDAGRHEAGENNLTVSSQHFVATKVDFNPPWDAHWNRHYAPVEERAAQIYEGFQYDGPGAKPAWVANGNGIKQDEARATARAELSAAGHAPPT